MESTENSAIQTPGLPSILQAKIPRAPVRRKITMQDVQDMAQLVANRLTETEAALQIGLRPQTWFAWKCQRKRDPRFQEILAGIRGAMLKSHMEVIELHQLKDWRAADRLLQIKAPDRYSAQKDVSPAAQPVFNINLLMDGVRKVYGAVTDVQAKLLPDKPKDAA